MCDTRNPIFFDLMVITGLVILLLQVTDVTLA